MRILSICSARPNFVKLAAVHHAIANRRADDVEHIIVHTGQHYDPLFSDIFFTQLAIPQPNVNLGIHGGTRDEVISRTMEACLPVFREHKPDWVLVYGDVNGAVGAAKAARQLGIRLAHVEAGLRSFDLDMPEEHNRIAIDDTADLLLVSEDSGMENLRKEQRKGKALLVGNTMIDTLLRMIPALPAPSPTLPARAAIVTLHRPSNVDTIEALRRNMQFLKELSDALPVVFPVHHRTAAALEKFGLSIPAQVTATEPMGYLEFLAACKMCEFIVTDSGGIQEEAVLLRKRCFTLRKNTERPVTIASGSNVLIDLEKPADRAQVLEFAGNPTRLSITVPKLWDGKAGERILASLLSA
jgi:UDP-N-acetylglucosamine 2-epimerase (non-hydrolysing)